MVEFKLTISDKKGKSYQKEAKDDDAKAFIGLKIGDTVKGEVISLTGYEFKITGGSDYCGFPMRKDVQGTGRKKILAVAGTGLKKQRKGQRQRKTVCGNTVHEKISQINLSVVKVGKEPLGEPAKEEPKADAPKADAPKAEGKKADTPKEAPKEEKKPEEATKEEEPKKEAPVPKEKKKAETPKEKAKPEEKPKKE